MKTTILRIILPLLLILLVVAFLVWVLPAKATIFIIAVIQLLTLISLGIQQDQRDRDKDS